LTGVARSRYPEGTATEPAVLVLIGALWAGFLPALFVSVAAAAAAECWRADALVRDDRLDSPSFRVHRCRTAPRTGYGPVLPGPRQRTFPAIELERSGCQGSRVSGRERSERAPEGPTLTTVERRLPTLSPATARVRASAGSVGWLAVLSEVSVWLVERCRWWWRRVSRRRRSSR